MYTLSIKNFEGPLDLLLDLVRKKKLDILNISVSQITDDYIAYIEQVKESMDLTSDFIFWASYLTYLKSKELLPKDAKKEEKNEIYNVSLEEEKKNFAYILLRYKLYKSLASNLQKRNKLYSEEFKLPKREQELFVEENLQGLGNIFELSKYAFVPNHNIMNDIGRSEGEELKKEILYITSSYPDGFIDKNIFTLRPIFKVKDIVGVFLASLELARLGFFNLKIKDNLIFASTKKPLSLFDDYSLGVV